MIFSWWLVGVISFLDRVSIHLTVIIRLLFVQEEDSFAIHICHQPLTLNILVLEEEDNMVDHCLVEGHIARYGHNSCPTLSQNATLCEGVSKF